MVEIEETRAAALPHGKERGHVTVSGCAAEARAFRFDLWPIGGYNAATGFRPLCGRSAGGFHLGESKGTVLIVEDDADLAEMIATALEAEGLETRRCGLGREALENVTPGTDLVLLDRMLPDINGDEVLARIEADPELRDVPVIMMSVDGDHEWVTRLLEGGAVDYIVKPVRLDVLRARISTAIRTKRRRERLRDEEERASAIKRELEALYDSLQEGLMLVDAEYRVRRVNSAMLKIFGKRTFSGEPGERDHEVLGQRCHEALYGLDGPCEGCPVAEAASSGEVAAAERRIETSVGERRHRTVAVPVGPAVAVSLEDVTDARRDEEHRTYQRQLEAVSNLAAASSHEMNQPLGVISGRAQLLRMRLGDSPEGRGKLAEDIEEILSATKRIENLIERLHNVTDYVTKPYVGGREILDVEKSTERFRRKGAAEAAEAGGAGG